eukprot:TRINITY_DN2602_c0_g1_i1.p2 TRINITY_DN2602_c0_g1~~TRINITY_DN2602_c0_g1_i1.p2  ORF type:complete len:113 (-),score=41.77 TRINITY_DN2602_c0_g1_i1:58-396(-)
MCKRDSMYFFFFKQKTAYEMLRSLVGSEMCIRDRQYPNPNNNITTTIPTNIQTHVYDQDYGQGYGQGQGYGSGIGSSGISLIGNSIYGKLASNASNSFSVLCFGNNLSLIHI